MREISWDTHYQSGAPPWETGQPSQELARVPGDSILLTTHFSGADEAGASDGASPLNSGVLRT